MTNIEFSSLKFDFLLDSTRIEIDKIEIDNYFLRKEE